MRKLLLSILIPIAFGQLHAQTPAVDLAQPVTEAQMPAQRGMSTLQKEMYLAPVREWQQRAVRNLSPEGSSAAIQDTFALVAEGIQIQLKGRSLSGEYLASLPDTKITELLGHGKESLRREQSILAARQALAGEALRRPQLASIHDQARFESAYTTFLLDGDVDGAIARLKEASTDSDWGRRAAAFAEGLERPNSLAAVRACRDIMRDASLFEVRFAGTYAPKAILNQARAEGGVLQWASAVGGDDRETRLSTATRAAFEVMDGRTIKDIESGLQGMAEISDQCRDEIRFWIAQSYLAAGANSEAATRFAELAASTNPGRFRSYAAVRFMECEIQLAEYVVAAEQALDILDRYSDPEVRQRAQRSLEFLTSSGLIQLEEVKASHAAKKKLKPASATALTNHADGGE